MKFEIPDFNGSIPSKYTCDGEDVNPRIIISEIPEEAVSLAVVVDDPDAPGKTFDHWIAWNLPLDDIEEGEEPGTQGTNNFNRKGYRGPCPPGETHEYRFKVYALSKKLNLKEGSRKRDLEKAMKGKIVDRSVLKAEYGR